MSTPFIRRGQWVVSIDHGTNAAGKRVRLQHRLGPDSMGRKEARQMAAKLQADARSGGVASATMPIGELLDRWLEVSKPQVTAKTHERYGEHTDTLKRLLRPVRLDKLSAADIAAAMAKAATSGRKDGKGGLSPQTVRHLYTVLKTCLNWAVDNELLARVPMSKRTAPKLPKSARAITGTYTMADITALVSLLQESRIFIAILLLAMTGCRRGEVCALRWKHIDLDRGVITIATSVEQTNKGVAIKSTKAERVRSVSIGAGAIEMLRAHRQRQEEEFRQLDVTHTPEAFVCSHPGGEMFGPRWLTSAWSAAVKNSGLPKRGLHHLRHAHATELLATGTPIKVVADRLGHSTPQITLDTYAHVLPGADQDAARHIDQALAIEHQGGKQ